MLKKLLCVTMSTAIVTTLTGTGIKISAKESSLDNDSISLIAENNNATSESFDLDAYDITITEDEFTRTVVTVDKNTNETNTAIYDKTTNQLHDEKGNYLGTGYVKASRGVYGPFTAYFDINPASVGAIIGCILAVAAIVSVVASAGLSLAAFKAGIAPLFSAGSAGTLIERWAPNASINGYFQYKQEISGTRARNLDRVFATRVGRSGGYTTVRYGNGGWFDTVKPY